MRAIFALISFLLLTASMESLRHSQTPTEWAVEGGEFAKFFIERTRGRGIHKWVQYFPAYNRHFQQFVGKEVHIVEIGVQSGGSLDMWKAVLGPHVHVYGVDINGDTKQYEDQQTRIFIGDQADPYFWAEFKKEVPRVDILIDDGGHEVDQMLVTLSEMLPHLSSNGVFMTEDIHFEENHFWTDMSYDLVGKEAGSLHIYPYLFVVEKSKHLDVMQHLGTTSEILSSDSTTPELLSSGGSPFSLPSVHTLPEACSEALQSEEIPTASCLQSTPPQSVLLYLRQAQNLASSKALLISPQFQRFHHGGCCKPDRSDLQNSLDSVHIYPRFVMFKQTWSNATREIECPQHGTEWIPYHASS